VHLTVSWKKIIWIVVAALGVSIIGIAAVIAFWLPGYIESDLISHLAQTKRLEAQQVFVRRIGINGADLGPIMLGADGKPIIRIAAIQIDYSLLSLLRKRIKGIRIGGLRITLPATASAVPAPGIKPPTQPAPEPSAERNIQLSDLLPIALNYIQIEPAEIVLIHNAHRITISFRVDLNTADLKRGRLLGHLQAMLRGNQIDLSMDIDQSANRALLTLRGENLDMRVLSALSHKMPLSAISGMVDIAGQGTVQLNPPGLDQLSVKASLHNTRIVASEVIIENPSIADQNTQPIEISIDRDGPRTFIWQCTPFQISAPFNTLMTALSGQWSIDDGVWELRATGRSESPSQELKPGMQLKTPLVMQWHATAAGESAQRLSFNVQADAGQAAGMVINAVHTEYPNLGILLNGTFGADGIMANAKISANHSRLTLPDGYARIQDVNLAGNLIVSAWASPRPYRLQINGVMQNISADTGPASVFLPAIQFNASGQGDTSQPLRLHGRITFKPGTIRGKQHELAVNGISIHLPYHWPPIDGQPPGKLRVRDILWKDRHVGGIKGQIRQQGLGLAMVLNHTSKLFPGLNILIDGTIDRKGVLAKLKMPPYQPSEGLDPGEVLPQAAGMRIDGRFEGGCKLRMNRTGTSGTAQLSVKQGKLSHETQELTLDGLEMDLHIDELVTLRSGPMQTLRIDRLQFGNLAADDLRVDFQIETLRSIFIEKAAIKWCKGTISAGALRIKPGHDDYELTLFCDRLDLAMVLEQLGAVEAGGEGAVNGRIPLHWTNGGLTFNKGFLFSTPGKSGTIRLRGTEMLLAGLPPGTPQHTQLDIATEALKDYTYKWARLYLESEEENLLLKLQFDGKPNQQLPFAYDTTLGSFKRVAGEGQADFTGISIDLNFRSPLNEILQYKELFTPNRN
jgi:hypothetical protein